MTGAKISENLVKSSGAKIPENLVKSGGAKVGQIKVSFLVKNT